MLSVLFGLLTVALSLWGLIHWWPAFIAAMKGLLPLCFLMGGLVAIVAGVSSLGGAGGSSHPKK